MQTSSKTTRRQLLAATVAGLCAFIILPARVNAQTPQYTVTVLSGLGGTNGSVVYGVNAFGQVAGWSFTAGYTAIDAVVWNGTVPTALTSLGGTPGSAIGINASAA